MIAFAYYLELDGSAFTVMDADNNFMLGANVWDAPSGPTPHTGSVWRATAVDLQVYPAEHGSGVLTRIDLEVHAGATSGLYVLSLDSDGHVDTLGHGHGPDVMEPGVLAIGVSCPVVPDADSNGIDDIDEVGCLQDQLYFDCDGDGYAGYVENHLYERTGRYSPANFAACGTAGPAPWFYGPGWPADLAGGSSENRIDIMDVVSFFAPTMRLNAVIGDPGFHVRWDLVPDDRIDMNDISSVLTLAPSMLGGAKAFGSPGPPCPYAP